jgi:mRNA-degrading endonuclease RelE of RelBE toxin-antitoxin system
MTQFRIADTFTDSLAKLTGDEQKAVKTTAFDLQLDPVNPGMQLHKIDRTRDRNFWSVRVSRDIRLIVHKTQASLLLCYVDHHDDAYRWAERRKLETHPKTGAAQLVEIRERVEEITIPRYVEEEQPPKAEPPLFADVPEQELLGYGVPPEWLPEVRKATEDTVLELADHLPGEAAEALLDLATGTVPRVAQPTPAGADPFAHPDAQRRFRTVTDVEELERALDFPWDKWTIFLHPAQRATVEREYGGPARVAGSAGTGKTIVALHRAGYLARADPDARVLLTTFSGNLANALRSKLFRLVSNEPRLAERIEVHALDAIAERLYTLNLGRPGIASGDTVRELLDEAAAAAGVERFSSRFLLAEWADVVDAWQLGSWEEYRDVARLGRKTRLPQAQRETLWSVFERVRASLDERGLITRSGLYTRLAEHFAPRGRSPFDFIVIDEAQDLSVAQLRFLAALGGDRPNALFFAGDLGQRIFQAPFSWKSLGVDVRGRSRTLRINYRTSHQIRQQADRLLGPEIADVDGIRERREAISVFNGPDPTIITLDSPEAEIEAVGSWLADRIAEGVAPEEIGVFVRSPAELERACTAVEKADIPFQVLDENVGSAPGHAAVSTMHLAKGLEFRTVAVMACDDETIPLQERIETVSDESDLQEVYDTERNLLYVACTRARDHLLVSSGDSPSEFLDDLRM